MENKNEKLELKAWLYMFVAALFLIAIGLIFYMINGSGSLADFFSKLTGTNLIVLIAIPVIIIIGIVLLAKLGTQQAKSVWTIKQIVVGAMCLALAYALSCIKIFELPNGGSFTPASMLPIFVFAYIYGPAKGLFVSFIYCLLQLIQGIYFESIFQFMLDYIFGYTLLGVAGFFRHSIIPGIIAGGFLRFLSSFLSGVIFYGAYAPEGQSPFVYSLLYNGSYMLPEVVICILIAIIPLMNNTIEKLKMRALNNGNAVPPQDMPKENA